jgi:hypothetical protein
MRSCCHSPSPRTWRVGKKVSSSNPQPGNQIEASGPCLDERPLRVDHHAVSVSPGVAIARSSAILPLGDLQRNPQRCLQGATMPLSSRLDVTARLHKILLLCPDGRHWGSFCGWAIALQWQAEERQLYFRPVSPSDHLKMDLGWIHM